MCGHSGRMDLVIITCGYPYRIDILVIMYSHGDRADLVVTMEGHGGYKTPPQYDSRKMEHDRAVTGILFYTRFSYFYRLNSNFYAWRICC